MAQSEKQRKNAIASREIDAREEVARYDMAFGIASIARPLKKGSVRTAFIKKQGWKGGVICIRGITPDDHDLGVLLAFIVLAEQQRPERQQGREVAELLLPTKQKNAAADLDVVTVAITYAAVRQILGLKSDSGTNNAAIWQSLCNLATIVIDAQADGKIALTHLIRPSRGTANETLTVTLSYRLTRALLGEGSYGAIDMKAFRALPGGATRILFVWFCSWFGGSRGNRRVGLNKLVEIVWGEPTTKMAVNDIKNRRRAVRNSLTSIQYQSGHWRFDIGVNDNVTVKRIAA